MYAKLVTIYPLILHEGLFELFKNTNFYTINFLPLILAVLLMLPGCAERYVGRHSTDELIELLRDRNQADRYRRAVIEVLQRRQLDANQHQGLGLALAEVTASNLHSPVIRSLAAKMIVDRYPNHAAMWLSKAILITCPEQLYHQLLESLVNLHDRSALPNLIISLAATSRLSVLQETDIAQAIEKIAAAKIETVLTEQLAEAEAVRSQIAVLACLERIMGHDQAKSVLLDLPGENPLLESLQFWARRFDYLPTNDARFLACRLVSMRLASEKLTFLHGRVQEISRREHYRFDIRDTYTLLELGDEAVTQSGSELIRKIEQRLSSLGHTKRPGSYAGAPDDYPEDFIGQYHLLSYTDLLHIKLLLDSLAHPETIASLREFLQQDFADTETEIGGLSFLQAEKVVFRAYRADRHLGDNQYVESPQAIHDAVLCLARWHCHADAGRRGELAGPGIDDLNYAAYFNSSVIVITYINDKKINVDYFTPDRIVIDLGIY